MSNSLRSTSGIGQNEISNKSGGCLHRLNRQQGACCLIALISLALLLPYSQSAHAQSVLPELTVAGDALLKGQVGFGVLAEDLQTTGFVVDVVQSDYEVTTENTSTVTTVVSHPGYMSITGQYVDVWGYATQTAWVVTGTETVVTGQTWVVTNSYYDENNNLVEDGYWEDVTSTIETGYWDTTEVYSVIGSEWQGVETWIEGWDETITQNVTTTTTSTQYDDPIVRFTGMRAGTQWVWRNPAAGGGHRKLMKLTTGGLQFPHPEDEAGLRKSEIAYHGVHFTEFVPPETEGPAQSIGSQVDMVGIKVWAEEGPGTTEASRLPTPDLKFETSITKDAVQVQRLQPLVEGGGSAILTTRVGADHATFGGSVHVKGALIIAPQGDISMGQFTAGPQP